MAAATRRSQMKNHLLERAAWRDLGRYNGSLLLNAFRSSSRLPADALQVKGIAAESQCIEWDWSRSSKKNGGKLRQARRVDVHYQRDGGGSSSKEKDIVFQ